jgi:hypothetical protein
LIQETPPQIAQETTHSNISEPDAAGSNQETLLQIAQETTHSNTITPERRFDSSTQILKEWGEHDYPTTFVAYPANLL